MTKAKRRASAGATKPLPVPPQIPWRVVLGFGALLTTATFLVFARVAWRNPLGR